MNPDVGMRRLEEPDWEELDRSRKTLPREDRD